MMISNSAANGTGAAGVAGRQLQVKRESQLLVRDWVADYNNKEIPCICYMPI